MADVFSAVEIFKSDDINKIKTQINDALRNGWTIWKFDTENLGTPEYYCVLGQLSTAKAAAITEIPKIETALNLLKTDTTANSIGPQITAITNAITAANALNLNNADLTTQLTNIKTAIDRVKSIADAQRTAISTSKDAIKNAQ